MKEDKEESDSNEDPGDEADSTEDSDTAADVRSEEAEDGKDEEKEEMEDVGDRGKQELRWLKWMEDNGIDGFVNWTPVEHPDFPGKLVEVGGFKPYVFDNPPATEIKAVAGLHLELLNELAGMMPSISVNEYKIDERGSGVYRISVELINSGYLPLMSAMGDATRQAYPLQVQINLPDGAELLTGHQRFSTDSMDGKGGTREFTWLVRSDSLDSFSINWYGPPFSSASASFDNNGDGTWHASI